MLLATDRCDDAPTVTSTDTCMVPRDRVASCLLALIENDLSELHPGEAMLEHLIDRIEAMR